MFGLILKYIPSVVIPTFVSVITTMIYGRYLHPSLFGEYNIFITTITTFNAIFFTFMGSSVLRFFRSYREKNEHGSMMTTFNLTTVLLLLLILLIGYPLVGNKVIYFIICLASFVLFTQYTNALRATENILWFNIIKITIPILSLTIILVAIYLEKLNSFSAVISMYFPMLLTVIIITTIFYYNNKVYRINYSKDILMESLKYGLPLTLVGLSNIILSSSDRYMIQAFLGSEAVGIYSFSYRIAELSMVNVTLVVIMALYPQAIKEFEDNGAQKAANLVSKYLNIYFILIIPLIFIIYIYIDKVMILLFPQYKDGSDLVKYVSLGMFFFTISYFTNKAFELTKKTALMIKILIITAAINIILNFVFIPLWGSSGAVITTVIAYALYVFLSLLFTKPFFNIKISFKSLFITIIANIIVTLLTLNVFNLNSQFQLLNVLVGLFIYIGLYSLIVYFSIKKKFLLI